MTTPPAWQNELRAALKSVGKSVDALGHRMITQAALGSLLDQDPAAARAALAKLPAEQRAAAAAAAHALALLAEEPKP